MQNRLISQLAFLFLLFVVSLPTLAININEAGDHNLGDFTEFLQVPLHNHNTDNSAGSYDSNSSLIDISKIQDWQHSDSGNLNFGFKESPFWFKTKINLQQQEHDWFLRILYPPLDNIYIYLCQSEVVNDIDSECDFHFAGDSIPFYERLRSNPNHIVAISPSLGDNFLYIKLDTKGSYQLPISMIDKKSLDDYLAINDFFRGAYLSLMVVMILYNLFIYTMTRSPTYVLYSGFVFTFLLFHMTYEGSGFQYLWPNLPALNEYAIPVGFSVNLVFTVLFVMSFLNIQKSNRFTYNYFNALLLFALGTLFLIPFVPYSYFIPLMNLLSLTISGSAFYLGVKYWREGQSAARLFTIAWVVLTVGLITANLKTLGVIPSNFFTRYSYQVGSFLEVVLLSLALGERIQRLQHEHVLAKQALIQEKQDKMNALKQLIIGISHEMNTPIGNIALSNSFLVELNEELQKRVSNAVNFADLTQQELIDYIEQQEEAIQTIASSKKTLSVLTHVFSNISVKQADHPKAEFDLVDVLQDRILTYQDRIDFHVSLPEQCIINSHPSAFILVLNQALDNVLDHVTNSQHSEVSDQEVNSVTKPCVFIDLKKFDDTLSLAVSDSGSSLLKAGLTDADLIQLFFPFYTKGRGSQKKMGLGMYQMKNIVIDLLKGQIVATLNNNGGLKLSITFNIQ